LFKTKRKFGKVQAVWTAGKKPADKKSLKRNNQRQQHPENLRNQKNSNGTNSMIKAGNFPTSDEALS